VFSGRGREIMQKYDDKFALGQYCDPVLQTLKSGAQNYEENGTDREIS